MVQGRLDNFLSNVLELYSIVKIQPFQNHSFSYQIKAENMYYYHKF